MDEALSNFTIAYVR
ncbi:unnamed protein product, partial [Rotaria magnacalcarata]